MNPACPVTKLGLTSRGECWHMSPAMLLHGDASRCNAELSARPVQTLCQLARVVLGSHTLGMMMIFLACTVDACTAWLA